jgi:hypothetical protein
VYSLAVHLIVAIMAFPYTGEAAKTEAALWPLSWVLLECSGIWKKLRKGRPGLNVWKPIQCEWNSVDRPGGRRPSNPVQ